MSTEKMEEETYSLIFKSLKHPIRRKILRMLVGRRMGFSEILDVLSIDSGHLSYHIENLGDLVKHSEDGKYELSSIGVAAVNLMTGVEEHRHLSASASRWKTRKIWSVFVVVGLVALMASAGLNVYYYNSLQSGLKANSSGSSDIAVQFHLSVCRATDVGYLLRTYREGLRETEANEANVEALVEGFFHEMDYAYFGFLRGLMTLNPELCGYGKPLYLINRFVLYAIVNWEPLEGKATVRSVFADLIAEAHFSVNYSVSLIAFKELNQTCFPKMRQLSFEVAESFAPYNATRLSNTANIVEELEDTVAQWINNYA